MSTKNSTPVSENDGGAIEFLLRRMQRRRDFPVLSETIRTLNRLSASNEKSVEHLAAVIVRDYALTNKILKVVNSARISYQANRAEFSEKDRKLCSFLWEHGHTSP